MPADATWIGAIVLAMAELHVLRVFVDESGAHGNPLGVFLDGAAIPPDRRAEVAARLGFSETVFVDNATSGEVRVFTRAASSPSPVTRSSGPPGCSVSTGSRSRRSGRRRARCRPGGGWVGAGSAAAPRGCTRIDLEQLPDGAAVDRRSGAPPGVESLYVWAWEDEAAGRVRS